MNQNSKQLFRTIVLAFAGAGLFVAGSFVSRMMPMMGMMGMDDKKIRA